MYNSAEIKFENVRLKNSSKWKRNEITITAEKNLFQIFKVQNRFATLRRDELSRTAQSLNGRRSNLLTPESARILSFRTAPVIEGGPPPYMSNPTRG